MEVPLEGRVEDCDNCDVYWTTIGGHFLSGANDFDAIVDWPGEYIFHATNLDNGCIDDARTRVVVIPGPTDFDMKLTHPDCFIDEGSVLLTGVTGGVGPYTYSVEGITGFISDSLETVLPPGQYELELQDANGCVINDKIEIIDIVLPEIEIEPFVELDLGEGYQIQLGYNIPFDQIEEIIWSPPLGLSCSDCLDPYVIPVSDIEYQVTLIAKNGCIDDDLIEFVVIPDYTAMVPNVFSPNEDGYNDGFTAFSNPDRVRQINKMMLFDRWGELLFSTENIPVNDPDYGWDGSFRGSNMNPGVFVYIIEIEFIDGTVRVFKGDVTLVR
jgi:gliding motility-associated-like protein